ncbi:MAG: hypothetical protein CL666_16885 [Balneola sp.]|nr:hypothetical protein [Balneola sp.]|tara:strand:- start:5241 stop:5474 length:234 start_codon:yes stop_codon:yes gene_type:complete
MRFDFFLNATFPHLLNALFSKAGVGALSQESGLRFSNVYFSNLNSLYPSHAEPPAGGEASSQEDAAWGRKMDSGRLL